MRKVIFLSLALAVFACNKKTETSETDSTVNTDTVATAVSSDQSAPSSEKPQTYACSMHPEQTGKQGDKCSKCGMPLTEVVEIE